MGHCYNIILSANFLQKFSFFSFQFLPSRPRNPSFVINIITVQSNQSQSLTAPDQITTKLKRKSPAMTGNDESFRTESMLGGLVGGPLLMALCGCIMHLYRKRSQKREMARRNERFRYYFEQDNDGRITYPSTYAEGSRRLRERILTFGLGSIREGRNSKDGRSLREGVSQLGEPVPAFELSDFTEGNRQPREEVATASELSDRGEEDRPERETLLVLRTSNHSAEGPTLMEAMTAFELSDLAENGRLRPSSVRSPSPVYAPRSPVTRDEMDPVGSTDIDVGRRGTAWWRHFDN